MLSSLTTLVPVLSGPNYQAWSVAMKSFLMSQGQWRVLSRPCPRDITLDSRGVVLTGDGAPSDEDIAANKEKIKDWEDDNQKAVGNMMLRLAPQIQGNLSSEAMDGAGLLWDHLESNTGNLVSLPPTSSSNRPWISRSPTKRTPPSLSTR